VRLAGRIPRSRATRPFTLRAVTIISGSGSAGYFIHLTIAQPSRHPCGLPRPILLEGSQCELSLRPEVGGGVLDIARAVSGVETVKPLAGYHVSDRRVFRRLWDPGGSDTYMLLGAGMARFLLCFS